VKTNEEKRKDFSVRVLKALFATLLFVFGFVAGVPLQSSLPVSLFLSFLLPFGATYLVAYYFLEERGAEAVWFAAGVGLNNLSLTSLMLASFSVATNLGAYLGALLGITLGIIGNFLLYQSRVISSLKWKRVFLFAAFFPYTIGQVLALMALILYVFLRTFSASGDRGEGKA
jgi:uncharacterized membrane protein YeaQ/YmgE (transglycosylase-associated protein family)